LGNRRIELEVTMFLEKMLLMSSTLLLAGCASSAQSRRNSDIASDGPAKQDSLPSREDGNAAMGRDVFRFETFGNEGFWTDAVRMPQGIKAAKVTPLEALKLGLSVDVDALDGGTRDALMQQLKADPTGNSSSLLNDPAVTAKLVNANAVIGMPIKDSNGDGVLDVDKGDKVGASCALCHTITDGSVFSVPNGGSVGHRLDGRANHNLNIGKIFATGANSRALYPILQLALKANGGKTLGRAPRGLTEKSTEAEVDAYLSNPEYYPVGMFDDTFDGNGDPMQISPLFRQDLAAPYGSEGTIARLDNFGNLVYTSLFDLTELTTPGGRAFLHKLAGGAGDELADNYVMVLKATGVKGYPFVKAAASPNPGSEDAPIGIRVDNGKLLDLNAYQVSLQAPAGEKADAQAASRGRKIFRTAGCTSCHNVDQSKPVPSFIVPMKDVFPSDHPMILSQRMPPLNPIEDTPGSFFDDKMAVVNASLRGSIRGVALPLLLDLARKPAFLHDKSVPGLASLLDPVRGPDVPHPFYLPDAKARDDMVEFLRSLGTNSPVSK
jgi:cytochrome c2